MEMVVVMIFFFLLFSPSPPPLPLSLLLFLFFSPYSSCTPRFILIFPHFFSLAIIECDNA